MIKNKKGMSINDIYPTILIIALVAILIAIILIVLPEIQQAVADDAEIIENHNTTIVVTEAGYRIANATLCGFSDFEVIYVNNRTGAIPTANYTVNDLGVFAHAGAGAADDNNTYWNLSYSFNWDSGDKCDATDDLVTDFVDFIPWIGIILLVIAAAIVLGILVRSFGTQRTGV